MTEQPKVRPEDAECDCTGPYTQTMHANNGEGHQVGCPRWGIPWKGFPRWEDDGGR